jgi:hypothetical protein
VDWAGAAVIAERERGHVESILLHVQSHDVVVCDNQEFLSLS